MPTVPVVVGDDVEACAEPLRAYAALYVGGMGSREQNFYNQLAVRMGYGDAAATVQERYLARDYAGAGAAVPLEFIDQTSLIGPIERIADGLQAYAETRVSPRCPSPTYAPTLTEQLPTLRTIARGARAGGSPGVSWFEAIVLGSCRDSPSSCRSRRRATCGSSRPMFGWEDPGAAFTAVTQLGTTAAVLLFFWQGHRRHHRRLAALAVQPEYRGNHDARMGWYVILGTIPVGVLGFAFRHQIKDQARDLRIIAAAMIVRGARAVGGRPGRQRATKELRRLDVKDGLIYGLAQSAALDPRRLALGRDDLGRSVPRLHPRGGDAVLVPAVDPGGAGLRAVRAARHRQGRRHARGAPRSSPPLIAMVVGYAVIAWLLRYVATHSFLPFVLYRLAVGVLLRDRCSPPGVLAAK